jgi:magnesium transporter
VNPARDLFRRASEQMTGLPGLAPDAGDYFRDMYDHRLRISVLIASYRDVLTSAMDDYLSTSSNRLNVVMQRLSLIATIFLPLTFVTGFFARNFGWLVDHITAFASFAVLGIGGLVVPAAISMILFRRVGSQRCAGAAFSRRVPRRPSRRAEARPRAVTRAASAAEAAPGPAPAR